MRRQYGILFSYNENITFKTASTIQFSENNNLTYQSHTSPTRENTKQNLAQKDTKTHPSTEYVQKTHKLWFLFFGFFQTTFSYFSFSFSTPTPLLRAIIVYSTNCSKRAIIKIYFSSF